VNTAPVFPLRNMSEDDVKKNRLQSLREEQLLSKAELARRAGVSVLTIDRVERGAPCRLDTKRKIILALGLRVSDKDQVFDE
jgi:DNA-binding XRE family transcriptional regulator